MNAFYILVVFGVDPRESWFSEPFNPVLPPMIDTYFFLKTGTVTKILAQYFIFSSLTFVTTLKCHLFCGEAMRKYQI